MSRISTLQRIRAALLVAAIGAVGFVDLVGCSLIVDGDDPARPVADDESVLHDLFPEVTAITGIVLPAGSIGGLVYGDFDCDGAPDLAIGDPDQPVAGTVKAGVVHVSYGNGATQTLYQYLLEETPPEADGAFGMALAAGDFDGVRCEDLAIGAPGHGANGRVHVVHGHPGIGLYASATENRVLNGVQADEYFGVALAAGRFNDDAITDLAIGSPKKNVRGNRDSGAVEVFYGGHGGLDDGMMLSQGLFYFSDIKGSPEENDLFGFSLAAGDFDGNGVDDLAVGVPGECIETLLGNCETWGLPDGSRGGAVNVFYGTAQGLQVDAPSDQIWHQDSKEVKGETEDGDVFGFALAAADFDLDGHADLAIGAPGEAVRDVKRAGAVNVLYGSTVGLQRGGNGRREDQLFDLDCSNRSTCGSSDLQGEVAFQNFFGASLAVGRLNDGAYPDLAIAAPFYGVDGHFAGAVTVLLGSSAGLDLPGNRQFDQGSIGAQDGPDEFDFFGGALAAADLDGDGVDELAVRVNDGDFCAVDTVHDLGDGTPGSFHCSGEGVPLFLQPFGIVDPDQVFENPTPEETGPGGFNLPHWDWEFANEPESLELVAGPVVVTPGQTIAVAWDGSDLPEPPADDDDVLVLPIAQQTTTFTLAFPIVESGPDAGGVAGGGGEIGTDPPVLALSENDWVGLYPLGAGPLEFVEWHYTDAVVDGTLLFTAPEEVGAYELRYLLDGGYEQGGVSHPVLVAPAVALAAEPDTATAGLPIGVCWEITSGQALDATDWIGLFEHGAANDEPVAWAYTDGETEGCLLFDAPAVGTDSRYQLRYLLADGNEHAAAIDLTVETPLVDAPEEVEEDPRCGLGSGLVLLLPALLRLRRRAI